MHKFILREPWQPPRTSAPPSASLFPKPPSPPEPPQLSSIPRPKTLEELASLARLADEPTPKPRGLFWDLFAGNISALAEGVLAHPETYDADLVTLARDLVEGRSKLEELTAEQRDLLNRGTLDFAQYRPARETPKAPPPPVRKMKPSDELRVMEPPPLATPGVDVPETAGGVRPYWWL